MVKLSVIIPLYNCEKFIERSLDSVYNQGLDNEDFEIIVVDDGSLDNSLQVVRDYSKDRTNLKVISQENKGEGEARNTALRVAEGEYFLCLDADDYLVPNTISQTLQEAITKGLDIYFYDYNEVYDGKIKKSNLITNRDSYGKVMTGLEAISLYEFHHSVCTSLFKKRFVDSVKVVFSETFWGTDVLFLTTLMIHAKMVSRTNRVCYNYVRYNQNAVTSRANMTPERYEKLGLAKLYVSNKLNQLISHQQNNQEEGIKIIKRDINTFVYFALINLFRSKIDNHRLKVVLNDAISNGLYPVRLYNQKRFIDKILCNIINMRHVYYLLHGFYLKILR